MLKFDSLVAWLMLSCIQRKGPCVYRLLPCWSTVLSIMGESFSLNSYSQMILFLSHFAPVEGMNYVIEIFLSLTTYWWRVWRGSEILSTFMHFKVEEGWVCISPLRKWKTAWHIILFRLESLIPHLKLFRMLLQTVAVAKDISKKGMQANGKLITIFGYCQDISFLSVI